MGILKAHMAYFIEPIVRYFTNYLSNQKFDANELIENRMGHKSLNISFNNLSRNAIMHVYT